MGEKNTQNVQNQYDKCHHYVHLNYTNKTLFKNTEGYTVQHLLKKLPHSDFFLTLFFVSFHHFSLIYNEKCLT